MTYFFPMANFAFALEDRTLSQCQKQKSPLESTRKDRDNALHSFDSGHACLRDRVGREQTDSCSLSLVNEKCGRWPRASDFFSRHLFPVMRR